MTHKDALNFQKNIHHFWRAFGGWTFALKDYYEMNFTTRLDDPNLPQVWWYGMFNQPF